MAFALNVCFKSVRSYDEALARWSLNRTFTRSQNPKRKTNPNLGEHDERALDGRKRYLNLRKLTAREIERNGSDQSLTHIAFRYHRTDCVIWRSDNVVILNRHNSRSTNEFANALMPEGMMVHYTTSFYQETYEPFSYDLIQCSNTGDYSYWSTPGNLYRMRGERYFFGRSQMTGAWMPLDLLQTGETSQIYPWIDPVLDKPRARAALKATRYADFKSFANAFLCMNYGQPGWKYGSKSRGSADQDPPRDLLKMLDDPTRWVDICKLTCFWPEYANDSGSGYAVARRKQRKRAMARDPLYLARLHADKLATALRLAIYHDTHDPCVVSLTYHDSISNTTHATSMLAKCKRYGVDQV